jgi:hypothetical protein
MPKLTLTEAFARYDAVLRNVQWSVSAWNPKGQLVVSLWAHHYRKGPVGTAEYADRVDRWSGPGNSEFRKNIAQAFAAGSDVRLIVVSTPEARRVETGEDASHIPKDFDAREDLVGKVVLFDGENYVIRFSRASDAGRPPMS